MEKRINTDRRRHPTTLWSSLRACGRRRRFRRAEEAIDAYADCASPGTTALVLFIVAASSCDALCTIVAIGSGASEANPLLRILLDHGVSPFVAIKVGLTAAGAWFLAVHQHFRLSAQALRLLASVYTVLLAYHASLLAAA